MELNVYQDTARTTRLPTADWMYLNLNLASECGELLGILAKVIRDDPEPSDREAYRQRAIKELGDVLWHVAMLADDLGVDLEDVAQRNIDKLADRQARGVLNGSGDER